MTLSKSGNGRGDLTRRCSQAAGERAESLDLIGPDGVTQGSARAAGTDTVQVITPTWNSTPLIVNSLCDLLLRSDQRSHVESAAGSLFFSHNLK